MYDTERAQVEALDLIEKAMEHAMNLGVPSAEIMTLARNVTAILDAEAAGTIRRGTSRGFNRGVQVGDGNLQSNTF